MHGIGGKQRMDLTGATDHALDVLEKRNICTLKDIEFSNRKFWTGFVTTSFPTALNEEADMSLPEIIEENEAADVISHPRRP